MYKLDFAVGTLSFILVAKINCSEFLILLKFTTTVRFKSVGTTFSELSSYSVVHLKYCVYAFRVCA